jgi:hypothetical protein
MRATHRSAQDRQSQEGTMGIFSNILSKLGIGKGDDKPASRMEGVHSSSSSVSAPASMTVVDVVAQLEKKAAASKQELNWRTSIVDLLKLLDIDSSFAARKELAVELGCPPELMKESADMNIWLHKTVLKKIAENGGNVPQDLLD